MTREATPLMQQYFAIKAEYSDSLLFFQVGDFYELFFDDAKQAAQFLGIALTARGKNKGEPIPLCGVPVHALDHYLTKLIKGGFKVAICDQLEPPQAGRVVKRGVTKVLTPGTLTDSKLLDEKSSSYLFSFAPTKDAWAIVCAELLTGQLFATTLAQQTERNLETELVKFFPDEIIVANSKESKSFQSLFKKLGYVTTLVDVVEQETNSLFEWLQKQFCTDAQKHIQRVSSIQTALHYFYAYLNKNQPNALSEFNYITFYNPDDFLILDAATQRNLELVKNVQDGSRKNTLFSIIDKAVTPMGSRLIKKWLQRPLIKKEAIGQRQQVLTLFIQDLTVFNTMQCTLQKLGDLERVIGRIVLQRAELHDYTHLAQSLDHIPTIKKTVSQFPQIVLLEIINKHINDFSALKNVLKSALNDDPTQSYCIKTGYDKKLDHLRELVHSSHTKIALLEQEEQKKTGIQSLKIRYNQVQGYYIEVTKPNVHLVPDNYKRLQTLVGKERFMTEQLQQLQADIMQARTEIDQVEAALFEQVKKEVASYNGLLRKLSHALSHLDALFGLSKLAYENGYVCPTFNEHRIIRIEQGRHPVVELQQQQLFIANDTLLNDEQSLWIITGPNMGGKSTYLRQVALNCILAQCGSFVPAQKADLPILDRIFTRIGAGDNLAEGKSTFLVEMEETASICTQATKNSLVILDEVGRGTSTFDGLAIAQSVVEYIYTQVQARCLFATHYHELTHLQETFPGIVSYYAASKKTEKGILFLYKMIKGVADGSFGVEVAKLAELPKPIINRAQTLLHSLTEGNQLTFIPAQTDVSPNETEQKLRTLQSLVAQQQALIESIKKINLEDVSAREALDLLWQWKSEIDG